MFVCFFTMRRSNAGFSFLIRSSGVLGQLRHCVPLDPSNDGSELLAPVRHHSNCSVKPWDPGWCGRAAGITFQTLLSVRGQTAGLQLIVEELDDGVGETLVVCHGGGGSDVPALDEGDALLQQRRSATASQSPDTTRLIYYTCCAERLGFTHERCDFCWANFQLRICTDIIFLKRWQKVCLS